MEDQMVFIGERRTLEDERIEEHIKEAGGWFMTLLPWAIALFLSFQLITVRHAKIKTESELETLRGLLGHQMVGRMLQSAASNMPELQEVQPSPVFRRYTRGGR